MCHSTFHDQNTARLKYMKIKTNFFKVSKCSDLITYMDIGHSSYVYSVAVCLAIRAVLDTSFERKLSIFCVVYKLPCNIQRVLYVEFIRCFIVCMFFFNHFGLYFRSFLRFGEELSGPILNVKHPRQRA